MDMQRELDRILDALRAYKEETACPGVVLGISGGKDSTVVAMLSKIVFGDKVLGVLMPNGEQKDISDSLAICEQLGLKHYVVNVKDAFDGLLSAIPVPELGAKKERILLKGEISSPVDPPDQCRFYKRCYQACEGCEGKCPALREVSPGHFVACHMV